MTTTEAELQEDADETAAETVVVSFPADLSKWGRDQIATRHFEAFLRKTKGAVAPGDVWEEFLDVGCCGNTLDVPLQVESVEGGDRMGEGTEIEYVEREACGIKGGWQVQSADGPNSGG
jgi:hypothetical protein